MDTNNGKLLFRDNRDMQEDKEELFDSVDTVRAALELFSPMLQEMRINSPPAWKPPQATQIFSRPI
jgi:argininosuccinate lyase